MDFTCPYCEYEDELFDSLEKIIDSNKTFFFKINCKDCEKEFYLKIEWRPEIVSEIKIIEK